LAVVPLQLKNKPYANAFGGTELKYVPGRRPSKIVGYPNVAQEPPKGKEYSLIRVCIFLYQLIVFCEFRELVPGQASPGRGVRTPLFCVLTTLAPADETQVNIAVIGNTAATDTMEECMFTPNRPVRCSAFSRFRSR